MTTIYDASGEAVGLIPVGYGSGLERIYDRYEKEIRMGDRVIYAADLVHQVETCDNWRMLFVEGARLILRHDIYEDVCGHVLDCEDFNKWCRGLGLKDFGVEHAAIEEPFLIMHKDSEEYKYFRAVLAL